MMITRILKLTLHVICCFGLVASHAAAQNLDWNQYGLERAWSFQAPTEPARAGAISVDKFVSGVKKRTVYEVTYAGGSKSIYVAGQVGRNGVRLDAESAAFQADVELRTLKALGHEDAKVDTREVPDVSLLVQTGSGQLLLLDGETGELRWNLTIGKPNLTNQSPAVGEDYVAAVNGTSLYIIDKEIGKLEQVHKLSGIPDAGPTIAGNQLMVPILRRPFEVYSLEGGALHKPARFRASFGRVTSAPVATPTHITWATDRGYLFLADTSEGLPMARVEARRGIVGAPAFVAPGWIIVGIEDGYVLATDLQTQMIQWEFFTGESLTATPYAFNETVYVATSQNQLFALNAEDGALKWRSTGVTQVVSGLEDRLYCVDPNGDLAILDVSDGRQVTSVPLDRRDRVLMNPLTDRVYVVHHSGLIECVRAEGARWPTVHVPLVAPDEAIESSDEESPLQEPDSPGFDSDAATNGSDTDEAMGSAEPADDPFGSDDANPFDTDGDDPFGSSAADDATDDSAADEENPFATGDEDPFADAGDDPFG